MNSVSTGTILTRISGYGHSKENTAVEENVEPSVSAMEQLVELETKNRKGRASSFQWW